MTTTYDCLIVGAGPAGGAAAYHLAKAGHQVLVLEKEALPRYKPCGGGVSPVIAQWFDFDFSPAISLKVNTIRYTWKMGDQVEAELSGVEPIWMVRRDIFDHFLVQQAQAQGAELRTECEVQQLAWQSDHWQLTTPQGLIQGRYLIAADGAKGPMAKWLGFKDRKRRLAAALEAEAPATVKDGHIAHFEFGMVKNGYIWNFPKAEGYSIGIGTFRGGEPQNLRQIVTEYATLFDIEFGNVKQYGHPLCLWDGPQTLHTQQALLAGEAACVVDPFTAEGIRPSIFSGIEAARAIGQALGGDSQALARYTEVMNTEWGTDMQWAQRLGGVFYRLPGLAYRVGVKRPAATQKMGKLLSGELRYRDVANSAIKKLSGSILPGRG